VGNDVEVGAHLLERVSLTIDDGFQQVDKDVRSGHVRGRSTRQMFGIGFKGRRRA
jgi:hypothetical protein